jgi:hypothetical protein
MERVQSELHAAILASVAGPLREFLASQALASLVVPREHAAALEAQLAALRREAEAERGRRAQLERQAADSRALLDKTAADLAAVRADAACKQERLERQQERLVRIAAQIQQAQAQYGALTTDHPRGVQIMLQACTAVRNMATGSAEDPQRARKGAESGSHSTSHRVTGVQAIGCLSPQQGTEADEFDEGQHQPSPSLWDQPASMALDCDTALPFCSDSLAVAHHEEERRKPWRDCISLSRITTLAMSTFLAALSAAAC